MNRNNDIKKTLIILKALIFVLIIAGLPLYIYIFHSNVISEFTDVDSIQNFILEHKTTGFLAYIIAQVSQIIICIIPGQPFQFAAGYVFGPVIALLLSIVGAVIGETLAFFIARLLGHDLIYLLFDKSKAVYYINKFNTKAGYFALFLFYFIPGFPKDMVNYVAGLSNLKWAPFVVISTSARILPMFGSILIGTFTKSQQWHFVIIVSICILIFTIIGYINKDRVIELGDRLYEKLSSL